MLSIAQTTLKPSVFIDTKSDDFKKGMAEAVRAVAAGGLVIDPRVARLALAAPGDEDGEPSVLALTLYKALHSESRP